MVNIGLIGCGKITMLLHIVVLKGNSNFNITAVCDTDKKALNLAGDELGISEERRYTDYRNLLKDKKVDAVVISTPNDSHLEITLDSIKEGKHFLLEKPITTNLEDAEKLNEAVKGTNLVHFVNYRYRYMAAARYAKSLIESGALGKIHHYYAQYFQGWAFNKDLPDRLRWRFDKSKAGSGALGDLGTHMIDLARFLVGEFDEVCSSTDTFIKERTFTDSGVTQKVDVDDYVHFLATINEDIGATFAITRYAYARGNYQRVEVYGDKGGIVYDLEDEDSLSICIGDAYAQSNLYTKIKIPEMFKVDIYQAFYNAINGIEDKHAPLVYDGYKAEEVLDAILESSETRTWVNIGNMIK